MSRAIDMLAAALGLVIAAPFLAVAVLAVRYHDQGPVFFRQERIGRRGRPFTIFKVRTMVVNQRPVEAVGTVGSDHPMVTPAGRWIRRLKIDELPQLLNVLRGEMSLVGPRPTIREQVDRYDDFQMRRLEVLPGVTGWAQVNGNIGLGWDERIALDVWYVAHRSWLLDVRILLRTVLVVIAGEKIDPKAKREALQYEDRCRRGN